MAILARILIILTAWGIIEWVDSLIEGVNLPWWLSLLMACFCSVSDILTIMILDWIFD